MLFPNEYRKTSPLAPQLLFAGQYTDQESGLAYNRFRYYDPESGNYISSDPIGLNGGETPYRYVHNVLDFLDPFGLAGCWQKYEQQIQDLYRGKASFSSRKYTAIVDGKIANSVSDNVVNIEGKNIAIEAKFVDKWRNSIRNPASKIGSKPFAIKEQAKVLEQAKKYSSAFQETIYHTNSKEFAEHYGKIFKDAGIDNVIFQITPFR
ncbi:RHS repeat domain-containing protein [Pasteurella sp. PK-2025]|uniref:RHS repeat domain-containing protein n=1 Tax=Pasteurella sp. PK-2025 TaxID=3413133 RepID=UPI003C774688